MTEKELQTIEAELQKRGYKKWTTCLTSTESYAWFKSFIDTFERMAAEFNQMVRKYAK